jgi:hypothetical protein
MGFQAKNALYTARLDRQWSNLEEAGLVRLKITRDNDIDIAFLVGEGCSKAQERREIERINRYGVWGIIGEYRISEHDPWQHGESCWGFIDEDWKDSGYDSDIKYTTIKELVKALKSRCPCCRKRIS